MQDAGQISLLIRYVFVGNIKMKMMFTTGSIANTDFGQTGGEFLVVFPNTGSNKS